MSIRQGEGVERREIERGGDIVGDRVRKSYRGGITGRDGYTEKGIGRGGWRGHIVRDRGGRERVEREVTET